MDRGLRILFLLYFLGLTLSAAGAFVLTGAWGPPSADFVNAMSVGLFLGMMAWFIVALGHGYLAQSREGVGGRGGSAAPTRALDGAEPAAEAAEKKGISLTIVGAAFGVSYLGLGLLIDAIVPYGFWVAEAVIAFFGVYLVLVYSRAFQSVERVRSIDVRRCDRCDIDCTYLPKFDAWHCPRCGTIYQGTAKTTSAS